MGMENKWLCLDVLVWAGRWDGIEKGLITYINSSYPQSTTSCQQC